MHTDIHIQQGILIQGNGFNITQLDLDRLQPGEWLNDNIIDLAIVYEARQTHQ